MIVCVNVNSKEFKDCCERLNVSQSTLEPIIHKYINIEGNENSFPSDAYIERVIHGSEQPVLSEEQVTLWEKNYQQPIQFPNGSKAILYISEVEKFFPKESIGVKETTDGKIEVRVAKPVYVGPNMSLEDFAKEQERQAQELKEVQQIGYSKEDNNIYHNKNLKDNYYKLLKYVKEHINDRGFSLKQFNSDWGTNFGFNPKNKEITTRGEKINGVSIWNPNDTKVETKKKIDRIQLLNYLSAKFGLKFNEISNDEYTKKAGSLSNCCVIGDTVYIRKGDKDKLTNEQLIEEFLHPLVNAIYKSNPELTNKLLEEAHNLFPDLTKQIAVAYKGQTTQVQDEELITQVLSKYLNKEISDNGTNTRKLVDYIKQFFENILDLVRDLFGDIRIEKDTRLKVSGKDIKTALGFKNLAELINSKEITFTDTLGENELRNNKTPKTFTFNDGITVNASFTPNDQQVNALNAMSDFIDSDDTSMTLSGYAGTGKTTLMEMLAEKMKKQHRRIVFSASTNKAAAVLKSKVSKAGFEAYTLNKVFGISVEVDDKQQEYDAKKLVNKIVESELIWPGDVVVIDEASMINEQNYQILNDIAEARGIKIIYVGDEAQLAPVNEKRISKVFRNEDGKIVRLTKVERTGDNAILKEATNLRNNQPLSGESSFNSEGKGVAYIKKEDKTTIKSIISKFVQGLKSNPNYFKILAYTNKAVTAYNMAVRLALGYKDGIPRVKEPMMGYSNWGYDWRSKTYRFINSESYTVTKVGQASTRTINVSGVTVSVEVIPLTLVDSFGKEDTFNYIDIKNNQSNRNAAITLAKEKSKLWKLAKTSKGETKKQYLQLINTIEQFLFVNDDIKEGEYYLQSKVIDFGYAMTIHKSQGSTFTHVLIDDNDVDKASTPNPIVEAEVDLDSDSVTVIAEHKDDTQVNIQQQLRYVGVSRATDTVSVISDDIKSEDSPLNHIKDNPTITQASNITTENVENPVVEEVAEEPVINEDGDSAEEVYDFNTELLDDYKQNAEFYSGRAEGADLAWDKYLSELGLKVKHFIVDDYDSLSDDEKEELNQQYERVADFLGRDTFSKDDYRGKLVRRDILQANAADAVFVIGTFDKNNWISGGSAYAATAAIMDDKEVYFYDLDSKKWYVYEYQAGTFWDYYGIPKLTPHAAVIGTRDKKRRDLGADSLRAEGHKAIKEVIKNTFGTKGVNEDTKEEDAKDIAKKEKEEQRRKVKQEKLDNILKDTLRLSSQVDALNSSDLVTMHEVTDMAYSLVYAISDFITEWQDNPKEFFKRFPRKRLSEDEEKDHAKIKSMTRQELVEFIGITELLEDVKEFYFGDTSDELADKAMLYYENFDGLIRFGASAFTSVESFGLSFSEEGYTVKERTENAENENFDNDTIAEAEENGDKQEHWQIDSRTVDTFTSMSEIVRRELLKCYELDSFGNPITNEFGMKKRINPRAVTSSIIRWTQGTFTLTDMIAKLKEKSSSNPWVNQLIDKLNNKEGQYADFQSQFFGVFCKHFQNYYIVKQYNTKKGKKYQVMHINNLPALKAVFNSIEVLIKMQCHPLFNSNGINKEEYKKLETANNLLKKLSEGPFESIDINRVAEGISYVSRILGYPVTKDHVLQTLDENTLKTMLTKLNYIVLNLSKELNNKYYNPLSVEKDSNGIRKVLKEFLMPLTDTLEDTAITSFYDNGKMYQSNVIPSFITKLINKFKDSDVARFEKFLEDDYGQYDWFRDTSMDIENNSSWRNVWLQILANSSKEDRASLIDHKVQLSFNKHNYMRDMTSTEYIISIITEFFSHSGKETERTAPAWYKIPMMSNKPSLEFIKFIRYKGVGFEDTLLTHYMSVFTQELDRILLVKKRNYSKNDPRHIKNFDTKGKEFNFLDFLNNPSNSELRELLDKKLNGTLEEDQEDELYSLVKEEIRNHLNAKAKELIEKYKQIGVFEECKKIPNIGTSDAEIEESLREFVWNDTFAAINILQLTITDTAYYANAEDLQKRLAQLHAPGIRPNVEATDYDGNSVCDGKLRALFLADFEKEQVIQNIIENLEVVFDRKIASASDAEKEYWSTLKDAIIDAFKSDINVADAQGYNCPTSYRKKALMFGKWNPQFEAVYQKLRKGEYNISDLEAAFQPLKPFVYTQVTKDSGVGGKIKVGMQFKNSEYLIILADAILQGEQTGKPNILRQIFEVMEESAEKDPTKGIDTVMFASAVKAGLHGRINLVPFTKNHTVKNEEGKEETVKEHIKRLIYDGGKYRETYIHTFPAEDYSIQQEVPKHFLDHAQAHGSQERYIIPSDLETVDHEGNTVTYDFVDNGKLKQHTAEEFKQEYEDTIADNIQSGIDALCDEFNISDVSIKNRNIALSAILQKEILSNPRYGMDLYFACAVDKDGNFNIPLGDPIQHKRIEQLINSIIKNRINKQKIAGGPVVQVSNFGTSKRLNIKFRDKNGNILPTLNKWLKKNKGKTVDDYKEFLKEKQAGIDHYECYAPAYMQEMFECFMDENGNIDIKAIEKSNPEMLEMIGYRIPTEDKYSIAPLKIVGFLPKEAGEGIMLPYEITLITGSDYDIDKFYLMRKEFNIKLKKIREIKNVLFAKHKDLGADAINDFITLAMNPKTRQQAYAKYPKLGNTFRREGFSVTKPKKGKRYNNNKVIDMTLAVLRHSTTADKILNPGGFEAQKRMGYMVEAYKNNDYSWEYLQSLKTDDLKKICMTSKNLCFIDVNTQFYEQNNAAGSILGMFAVQKIAHAVLENDKLFLDVKTVLNLEKPFVFAGKVFQGYVEIDATKNIVGEYIGKVLGSLVASAADAVKDPVLNLMNINSDTANALTAMIRMGIPFETASLLTSQEIISECIKEYNIRKLKEYVTFKGILAEKLQKLQEDYSINSSNEINTEEVTNDDLVKGLKNASVEIKYKGLLAFCRFMDIASELKGPTYATRFNSISNAVGPTIIDNIIMGNKLEGFSNNIYKKVKDGNVSKYEEASIETIFAMHPILKKFSEALDIANRVFFDMPLNKSFFKSIISIIGEYTNANIDIDRNLLNECAEFYLSYLLVNSGCIKEDTLDYYINKFPKKLLDEDFKSKYPDNSFIQAILFDTVEDSKGENRLVLKLETTGMDTIDKEILTGGWEDLYRTNPELAIDLFKYCFFRGGIGFNPKTFMHLLPTKMKQQIPNYTKSFSGFTLSAHTVVDQFIRHNWDNGKLVPTIELPNTEGITKEDQGKTIKIPVEVAPKDINTVYCKILHSKGDKKYHMYKVTRTADGDIVLFEVSPLGNNGEYLELSINSSENKAMDNPTDIERKENDPTAFNSPVEQDPVTAIDEKTQYYINIINAAIANKDKLAEFKKKPMEYKKKFKNTYLKHFSNKVASGEIDFDMKDFDELYEVFCSEQ